MKIALDAMGGDLAPKATVEGAVLAARESVLEVVLVGNRDLLTRELADHQTAGLKITIHHAPEVVTMDDSPLESVLTKPHSSIHLGFDLLKAGSVDGFVSAGNSGAVMAAAMAILGNLPHVERPAIASPVPMTGGFALLIDAGANADVKPIHLAQFAVMGEIYSRRVRSIVRPRVGILSNGEEDAKGTDLTRAAAAMLREMGAFVNYVGYVEGRDINRGKVDVVVTDGFTGNVALKTMEGFASFMMLNIFEAFGGNWRGRLGFLLVRKNLRGLREKLDPHEYGGAPLLGVNGATVISHGSSTAVAIKNALRAAANESLVRHVNAEISDVLGRIQIVTGAAAKPAGKGLKALFSRMRERLSRHKDKEIEPPSRAPQAAKADAPQPAAERPAVAVAPPSPNGRRPTGDLSAAAHADNHAHASEGSDEHAAPNDSGSSEKAKPS
ncbi:MAG: phosphate acyltransferase PlsX [Candidatus Binataceae bacterium]